MGYYVATPTINVQISAQNVQACYEALCALNARDDLKTGGHYGGTPTPKPAGSTSVASCPDRWFAWMTWNYDETCKTLAEVWQEVGFTDVVEDEDGVSLGGYDGKSGAEDMFLEAAAPFIAAGSYIVWAGEDGQVWVNVFDGQGVRHLSVEDMIAREVAALVA